MSRQQLDTESGSNPDIKGIPAQGFSSSEFVRTQTLLLDLSLANNSSQACLLLDEFVARLAGRPTGSLVDIHAGDLLLTRGVLSKIRQQIQRAGSQVGTMYATVPQTQQASLDEGFFVKREQGDPLNLRTSPIRQALPNQGEKVLFFNEPLLEEVAQQDALFPVQATETLYLRQNLRSGQTMRFHGNVVIVGDVHAGSEITSGGDILVWGELRGIAHAGMQGNFQAQIRAMKIEALQLRIADYIARRPDRIYYHKEGVEPGSFPELARVADGEIKIFKSA